MKVHGTTENEPEARNLSSSSVPLVSQPPTQPRQIPWMGSKLPLPHSYPPSTVPTGCVQVGGQEAGCLLVDGQWHLREEQGSGYPHWADSTRPVW